MSRLADEFGLGASGHIAPQKRSSLAEEFGLQPATPQVQGVVDTLVEGAKSTGRAISSTVDTYLGDNQGVVDKAKTGSEAARDVRLDNFYQDFAENTGQEAGLWDSIKGAGKAVIDNPAGAGLAVVEQLPNAAPSLAGGWAGMKGGAALGAAAGAPFAGVGAGPGAAIGGVVGGIAGMFLGNALVETGHKAMDAAGDGEFTEAERSQAMQEGAVKSGVITGVDALTLGIGGKVSGAMRRTTEQAVEAATRKALSDAGVDVTSEAAILAARDTPEIAKAVAEAQKNATRLTDSVARRGVEAGTLLSMETVGEGFGEYLGELAATGEASVPDAVLESILSLGHSGAEASWNMARTSSRLIQPTPTANNPNPTPVPRPDPSNGPLSAAAAMLPAPQERLGLPAPSTLYGDGDGVISGAGPNVNVDGVMQRAAQASSWVNPQNNPGVAGGPGMSQQTERGAPAPLEGQLIRGAGSAAAASRQPEIIEGEVIQPQGAIGAEMRPRLGQRQGDRYLEDQREEGFFVGADGSATVGRVPSIPPRGYTQGGPGMDRQAPTAQRYGNVVKAKQELAKMPNASELEVFKVGPKNFEIRQKVQPTIQGRDLVQVAREFPGSTTEQVAARTQPPGAQAAAARKAKARRSVNRDRDSLVQATIRLGGLKTEWRQDTTGESKGNKNVPGVGALWSDKTGTGLDDMAMLLNEYGYVPAGEMDNLGGVPWLQRALREELDGRAIHYAPDSLAYQQQIERELLQRYADEQAMLEDQREAEYAEIEAQYGPEIAAQARAFDEAEKNYRDQVLAEFQQVEDDYEQRQQQLGDFEAALDGRPIDQAGAAARDDELRQVDAETGGQRRASARPGESEVGQPGFSLEQQTERGLSEQAAQQEAAKQAEAEAQRLAEQKAQADKDRDDFLLTGSDRPADVGAARGQNDMFGAQPARTEAPATAANQNTVKDESPATTEPKAKAPAASQMNKPEKPQAATVIEDAGEKLGGARKDQLRTVRERLDDMDDAAIANATLGQLWPKGELDRIADPFEAALYHVVRGYIPAKPRVPYRVKLWVEKVKHARELLAVAGRLGADTTVEKMRAFSPSLNVVADQIELLTALDRKHWDRIDNIRRASGRYNKDGEMVPGSWVSLNIDGRQASFYGHDTVASAIPEIKDLVEGKEAPEKRLKFAIYRDSRSGEVFLGKDGDTEKRRLRTFADVKAASDFLRDQYDDAVALWDAVKNRDNVTKADMRRGINDPRVGPNHRNGQDVTPEQFLEAFGFRGVEFGNWVKQGAGGRERQGMLNDAFDAFMDLAGILNVPPKAMSLEGKLGIGFGSRGSGKASAHFEPGNIVINLTKTKGAGSLAHEWFHALDNYFARKRERPVESVGKAPDRQEAYITYRPEPLLVNKKHPTMRMTRAELSRYQANHPQAPIYQESNWEQDSNHPKGVRPQVEKAFAELVATLNASPMLQRAKVIDGKDSDGYWSRIIERGARSFETYVIARQADRGYRNDYLANVQTLEQFARDPGRYPYLTPDEQGPVNQAFDKLFSMLETRETEDGNVALYSRASYRQGQATKGSKAMLLRLQLARLTGGWQNAPKITVVQSIKDLPDAQRRKVERDGAFDVEGMFSGGQVYLVADNLQDVKHAAFVLQHEVLGHAGLQGAYGQRLSPLLLSLYRSHPDLKRQADALVERFGYTPAVATEEVLADMAAAGTIQQQAFWPRLVAAMRNVLRSIGLDLRWSEADIQALLANARRYIVNGRRRPGARAAFSRDGRSGRGPEITDAQGRLLAPNGKPSQLNQKQWHQARSENFKRWFGNWQGVATQDRLDAMKPLKLRMPESWKGMSEKQKLAAVEAALKNMARDQEVLHHDELGDVQVAMSGAKKAASTAADPAKRVVLSRLRESFERSIYGGSTVDQNAPNASTYHKLLTPVEIDGVPLVAVFTVREDINGRKFYNAVTVNRKDEAPAASPGEVSNAQITTPAFTGASTSAVSPGDVSNEAQRSLPANTEVQAFLRQHLARVNPDTVSKVTDGNGEPLVMYHGTGEDFTVFEQDRAGRSTGHATAALGIFMTSDREVAQAYAENASDGMPGLANVMPLFASIKKPYRMSVAESQALDTPQKAVSFRQKLEREGYDGIQLGETGVWVAFYNTQVKSATNNTGAFDEVDPDIRYRRTGQGMADAVDGLAGRFGPAQLDANDPFAQENRRLREQDKTLWSKAKQHFRRQFAPGGLLPESVFSEKVRRDSEFQAVEFDVRHMAGGLEKAVKADFGTSIDQLTQQQMKKLAEGLAGRVDPTLPTDTKVALVAMRQYIDSLSGEYIGILQQQVAQRLEGADPALVEKITSNLGSYVHRSYQAFDDPKWFQQVPTEVVNAARRYLADGYRAQGSSAAEANRLADVTVNEMLKTGTAYDSMDAFIAEGKLGAKDLSILIKRKEIAPEIRALLGEYMDPRLNFAKSATKMGRLIWNQRFLDRVRAQGMGTFLFEGKDRPAGATTQIAGEQSDAYAPLNGLWTFPEVAQAFKDALGKEQMGDLYRAIVRLNGMVKYGKTVLSPTTAMRNWQSAMFFSLANGHFDLSQMKKSWAAFREQVSQSATGDDLTYLRKLKQLGVVYDTPYAGEMMALLQDARMDELLSGKSGTGLKLLRKMNEVAQGFYSFGDDFWKIIGFENEKASLIKAGFPEAQAEQMAAERIRNTYPTYSMVGRGINWLRRFPLAGTFVSFPAEIIRTSVNMLRLTAADLKSDNPGLQAIGRKRVVGMAMVSAGFYALSAATAAALGVGDDEEEAIRDLAPPWQHNSTFLYTGRDADGKLRYFDMSFLDPYGYWKRPLTAMLRDKPWEKSAASAIGDMLSPFLGADITAGAIFEVMSNKKGSGGQVYLENASPIEQTIAIADHLRKTLQPGFVSNAERLWLASQGARREGSGQPYDMRDEVVSLLGWRASTLDTKTALYYRSFEFTDALSDARKVLNRTLRSSNEVSDGDIRSSRDTAQKQYEEAFKEMGRLVSSARAAGMNDLQIRQTLRMSSISQANVAALIAGRVPPMNVGTQGASRAVQQARMMQGAEHAQEIARRFAVARQQ